MLLRVQDVVRTARAMENSCDAGCPEAICGRLVQSTLALAWLCDGCILSCARGKGCLGGRRTPSSVGHRATYVLVCRYTSKPTLFSASFAKAGNDSISLSSFCRKAAKTHPSQRLKRVQDRRVPSALYLVRESSISETWTSKA